MGGGFLPTQPIIILVGGMARIAAIPCFSHAACRIFTTSGGFFPHKKNRQYPISISPLRRNTKDGSAEPMQHSQTWR